MKACDVPKGVLYTFVTQKQSVDQFFEHLYIKPTEKTAPHFKALNSHLNEEVRPGQLVIITPPETPQCMAFENDLKDVAARIEKTLKEKSQSETEAKTMVEHYSLLANVANYSSAVYGVVMNYFNHHKSNIEYILSEIEKLYVKMYRKYGQFNTQEFFKHRKILFSQLDRVLNDMVGRASMGVNIDRDNIKRSLGLSTKSIFHQLRDHPESINKLPHFEKTHRMVRNYTKILKAGGAVALVLDGLQSVAKVKEACELSEADCTKSKFGEGGRFAGSVTGGAFGGRLAASAICSVVFALPSGGSSLLWCNIVAGSIGGFVGGNVTSKFVQDEALLLYKNRFR